VIFFAVSCGSCRMQLVGVIPSCSQSLFFPLCFYWPRIRIVYLVHPHQRLFTCCYEKEEEEEEGERTIRYERKKENERWDSQRKACLWYHCMQRPLAAERVSEREAEKKKKETATQKKEGRKKRANQSSGNMHTFPTAIFASLISFFWSRACQSENQ
jgi:hypothetical protein